VVTLTRSKRQALLENVSETVMSMTNTRSRSEDLSGLDED